MNDPQLDEMNAYLEEQEYYADWQEYDELEWLRQKIRWGNQVWYACFGDNPDLVPRCKDNPVPHTIGA